MRQKVALLVLLALASVTMVSAQAGRLASMNVPFEFTVGDTNLPAGQYFVDRGDPSRNVLKISAKKGSVVQVPVITRLAQMGKGVESAAFVFDKVGTRRYLSEVWVPGADGFLVRPSADKHTHDIIKGSE